MKRVLLTGMSGVGKSTVIRELVARGFKAVDVEEDGLCQWVNARTGRSTPAPAEGEPLVDIELVWREDAIERLLSEADAEVLFVGGCASNQVRFHSRFDHIVLLGAPTSVIVERLQTRTNNPFGKHPRDLERALNDMEVTEPRLRCAAGHEIDTSCPLDDVIETILKLVQDEPTRSD